MKLSRRELFKALAAGATVVAGELWVPKLISIPSKIFMPVGLIIEDFRYWNRRLSDEDLIRMTRSADTISTEDMEWYK